MATTNTKLATYLSRPAPVEAEPPGIMTGARVYCFGFEGDRQAIDETADRYLNAAAEDGLVYRSVSPMVLTTFMDAEKLTSGTDPYGWLRDRELAFWTLMAAVREEGGKSRIERLVWWMPWVWVDTAAAMMTGRGVWGFLKSMGSFEIPTVAEDPAIWKATTRVFRKISPETQGLMEPLFTIQRENDGVIGDLVSLWDDATAAVKAFATILEEAGGGIGHPSLHEAIDLAEHFVHHQVPIVNLKQFRDTADGAVACFQSLVEGPCTIQHLHAGGLLPGKFSASILPCESHPIARELGLGSNKPEVRFAAWVDMDFSANEGRDVWRAGEGILE